MLFRNKLKSKFNQQVSKPAIYKGTNPVNPSYISILSSPIPAKFPKEVNKISKFFKKNTSPMPKKSYMQASSKQNVSNITRETLKIKNTFSNLQNKKIDQVQKIICGDQKPKPCINMTTKGPSHKQVIVPMNSENARKYMKNVSSHVININRALRSIKSNIIANFIRLDNNSIIISTNNITNASDLQKIERCVKNSLVIEVGQINSLRLLQSKSYLKIVGIPYLFNQINVKLSPDKVKNILKNNHIFNDVILASKPQIIKISPKSDMSIV